MSMHSERLASLRWFRDLWQREREPRLVSWAEQEISECKRREAEWRVRVMG